ncbi:MAG: hypothetical protein IKC02_05835, partial [Oscillospiraceae bacterium]|nr:hypothetical protein [Oscillospiraceae bacterium]
RAYADLVEDFRKIITFRIDPGWEEAWNTGVRLPDVSRTLQDALKHPTDHWSPMVGELPRGKEITEADYGYILHDLDADGTPELFWVGQDHTIFAIFTWHRDAPILLDAYWSRYSGYILDNNTLYTHGSSSAVVTYVYLHTLHQGSLTDAFGFGIDRYEAIPFYETAGDITIPTEEERVDALFDAYPYQNSKFWQSLPVIALTQPPTEYISAAKEGQLPYLQKISRSDFSIWNGPGYDYAFVDTVREATVYTIVAEMTDMEGNLWGKLKSGIGWVDLDSIYSFDGKIPLVTANFADLNRIEEPYEAFYPAERYEWAVLADIRVTAPVSDVRLLMLEPLDYTVYEEYCYLGGLEPLQAFVTELYFSGDFTTYGLSLIDEYGMERIFAIGQSGRNGELVVWEVTGNN